MGFESRYSNAEDMWIVGSVCGAEFAPMAYFRSEFTADLMVDGLEYGHRMNANLPQVPEPTLEQRVEALELYAVGLNAKKAQLEARLSKLSSRLSNLSRHAEDMPGGAELDC